ncbi:MAG: zinc-ribbon domain-containing protein, partial [Solirubrobacterales bacterium]|nr:zinc-ribbon domain-containing protein [Solirubrobacterales bacterium]
MSAHFCGACGAENPPGAKFCMSCGASQGATCPGCGAKGDIGARFCVECGTPYDAATAGAANEQVSAPASDEPELSEERRKATVLFADLSGYTAIAEKLDPEDTKALVDNALKRLSREVVDRGGRVDKYIGDNVMAVFGAPVAHEDDPERAVRTGLAMQAAMEEVNADIAARAASKDVKLSLRVGINSGEVLAGKMGEQYTVIGDTVNVASRLEASGRPGAVTVGALTHRLTAGTIDYVELEPLKLKGKSEPIPAWEAVAATGVALRERPSR